MNAREMLARQLERQLEFDRVRGTWWIPRLFVIGLGVSGFGLFIAVAALRTSLSAQTGVFVFTNIYIRDLCAA